MIYDNFFRPQIESLSAFTFNKVSVDQNQLVLDIQYQNNPVHRFGFEAFFQIFNRIHPHLAEIQSNEEITKSLKKQLGELKGRITQKINGDRGWFSKMSQDEAKLVDHYFLQANAFIDTPAPRKTGSFLGKAFKLGVLGGIAYGAYRYFGQ